MKYISLSTLLILFCFAVSAQQYRYNPSISTTTSNKPYGMSQAGPTDGRTWLYDSANFKWRPYVNKAEVLYYLYLPKYRSGQFPIIINDGGVLSNGVISGGVNSEYWFKNCTDDTCLVLKMDTSAIGSPNTSIGDGVKVAVDGTNNVKTLTPGYGQLIDSTSDEVSFALDSATVFEDIRNSLPVESDSLSKLQDVNTAVTYSQDGFIYDSISKKWVSSSLYFNSLKDLLYAKDTFGVKVVRSFHKGFRTGEIQVMYISSGTPDYITSWPSKNFSGYWQTTNVDPWIYIDKLGALGQLNTRVTAAGLGYSSGDLIDIYGSYFPKNTSDFIDEIAINQAISGLGIVSKKYRFLQMGSNRYYHKSSLLPMPDFTGANFYDFFGVYGNNTYIESFGGKFNVFMRTQSVYSGVANQDVNNRFIVQGINFINSDTSIGIHASYSSVIQNNLFNGVNVGVSLKWNLATFVSNNRWDGFDSVGIYLGHLTTLDVNTNTASAYSYLINNRFFARNHAKKAIHIHEVNGVYIEQSIFEGGDPDYNIYIDFKSGSFPFSTNTREMKIMGGHLENHPDSACVYFEGADKNLYIEKMYFQTPTSSPYVWAVGDPVEGDARVYLYNIPYWGQTKPLRSESASWEINDCYPLAATFLDTSAWVGSVVPTNLFVKNMKGTLKMPYYYNPPVGITNSVDYFTIKDNVGTSRFWGSLQVPLSADSNIFSPSQGRVYYHVGRSKFYGSRGSSWTWLVDSVGLFAPAVTATANGQTLSAFPLTATFNSAGFTGLTYRVGTFQTSLSGQTPVFYIANTNAAASSSAQLQLLSNAAVGSGGGVLNLYNDGRIIQAATGASLSLRTGPSSSGINFFPQNTQKGTFNSTGFRIGDAVAPTTDFEVSGTGAWLLSRGTTAQRPTGVNGYFRSNADSLSAPEYYGNGQWNLLADRNWARNTFITASTNIYNTDGSLAGDRSVTMSGFRLGFLGGYVGVNTSTPSQMLHVKGQMQLDTITSGSGSDSVLVVNNGLIKKVLQSSIGGSATTIYNGNSTLTSNRTVSFGGFSLNFDGNTGFGTTPSARVHSLSTTEQLRLGYDGATYGSFTVSSAGNLSITTTNLRVDIPAVVTLGTDVGNLWVSQPLGALGGTTRSEYQIGGSANVYTRVGIRGGTGGTLAPNASYSSLIVGANTMTEAPSGTHPLLSQAAFRALAVTSGAATVADAATVWIEGASNATVIGSNDAFRVNSGSSRFGGSVNQTNGSYTYTSSLVGSTYWLGRTNGGSFSLGRGFAVDTINNFYTGSAAVTTFPGYSNGGNLFIGGNKIVAGGAYESSLSITSSQTLGTSICNIYVDAVGGNVTVTLPLIADVRGDGLSGSSIGIVYTIKRVDNSGNTVTVAASGSDLIDYSPTKALTYLQSINIQAAPGNNWYVK